MGVENILKEKIGEYLSENYSLSKIDIEIVYQDDTWAMVKIAGTKLAFVLPGQHPTHFAIQSELSEFPCDDDEIKQHRDNSSYFYLKDPYGNAIEWINYGEDKHS